MGLWDGEPMIVNRVLVSEIVAPVTRVDPVARIAVLVRLQLPDGTEVTASGWAHAWTATAVHVRVTVDRHRQLELWVRPADVERTGPAPEAP